MGERVHILKPEELTPQHLDDNWSILAVDDAMEFAREIWNSRRLLPFVSQDLPGTMTSRLYVHVPSLDDEGVRHAVSKLRQIDPSKFDRIVGFPSNTGE